MRNRNEELPGSMKFFRDLAERVAKSREEFERRTNHGRGASDEAEYRTLYSYDLRKDAAHSIKDDADRQLLYNISQFLLASRTQLANKTEDQRIRIENPQAEDIIRLMPSVDSTIPHFMKRRRVRSSRVKGSGATTATDSITRDDALDDAAFAVGIDQATFVEVFLAILTAEASRVWGERTVVEASIRKTKASFTPAAARAGVAELRQGLRQLFDAMDADDCGVVSWDRMMTFMEKTRLSGDEVMEEQREGKLVFNTKGPWAKQRAGTGRTATVGQIQVLAEISVVMVVTKTPAPDVGSILFLDLYQLSDLRLVCRRALPSSTAAVTFLPAAPGTPAYLGAFSSSNTFQLMRMQAVAARNAIDLHPATPIQIPMSATHVVFSAAAARAVCVSVDGSLFTLNAANLTKPFRISSPASVHKLFHEPATVMTTSADSSIVFMACLFGGVASYSPSKDTVLHCFTASIRGEPVSIRAMAYLEDVNLLVTGGFGSDVHLWMSAPARNGDPLVGTLRHDAEPHMADIVAVWYDGDLSTRVVMSMDRCGTLKMWDLRQYVCLHSFNVGDDAAFAVLDAACASGGQFYYLANSARTHQCLLDMLTLGRAMVNPVAVAQKRGTVHHCGVLLYQNESSVISVVDGSILQYRLSDGQLVRYLPSACSAAVDESATAMCLQGDKKLVVGTSRGSIVSFTIASGEPSVSFAPLRGEVSGLVVVESQRVLVAASRERGQPVHAYHLPERTTDGDTKQLACPYALVTVPGMRGVMSLCEKQYTATTGIVVLWDDHGSYHQLTVEGTRVLLSSMDHHSASTPFDSAARSASQGATEVAPSASPALTGDDGDTAPYTEPSITSAEVNYHTDKKVFAMLDDGSRSAAAEVTCCCDLRPYGLVATGGAGSQLELWTAAPLELSSVKRWRHFSPRQVVPSVTTAVPTAIAFESEIKRLVVVDDHGCLSMWDLTHILRATEARRLDTGPQGMQAPDGLMASVSISEGVRLNLPATASPGDLFADVDVPLLHCYCLGHEPMVSIARMQRVAAYCCGFVSGRIVFVTETSSIVAELYPDPKFLTEAPLRFFLHNIAQVEELKAKVKERTRARELWTKLRNFVLGRKNVVMISVKELMSRARSAVDYARVRGTGGASLEPLDSSDDDRDAREGAADDSGFDEMESEAALGSGVMRKSPIIVYCATPANSPTRVRAVTAAYRAACGLQYSQTTMSDPLRTRHKLCVPLRDLGARNGLEDVVSDEDFLSATVSHRSNPFAGATRRLTTTQLRTHDKTTTDAVLVSVRNTLNTLCNAVAGGRCESVSLGPTVARPPNLFPPSIFKALTNVSPQLPPPEDLPPHVAPWILRERSRVNSATSIRMEAVSVPQLVPALKVLDLPNPLVIKYWSTLEDDRHPRVWGDIATTKQPTSRSSVTSCSQSPLSSSATDARRRASALHDVARPPQLVSDIVASAAMRRTTAEPFHLRTSPSDPAHRSQHRDAPAKPLMSCDFASLLMASAPYYPLQESPYLELGRPAPALSPGLFSIPNEAVHAPTDDHRHATVPRANPSSAIPSVAKAFRDRIQATRRELSTLHPDFVQVSLQGIDETKPIAAPGAAEDHRSYAHRAEREKMWAAQFVQLNSRPHSGSRHGGRIAKLRCSTSTTQHTKPVGVEREKSALPVRPSSAEMSPGSVVTENALQLSRPITPLQRPRSSGTPTLREVMSVPWAQVVAFALPTETLRPRTAQANRK